MWLMTSIFGEQFFFCFVFSFCGKQIIDKFHKRENTIVLFICRLKTLHVKFGNCHQPNLTKKKTDGKGKKPFRIFNVYCQNFILWH